MKIALAFSFDLPYLKDVEQNQGDSTCIRQLKKPAKPPLSWLP
jgi:hypothetical protein